MRVAICMALVALMLAALGPSAGEARAEVSIHLGYGFGYGYGYPYGRYRHRGYGYPYSYRHSYGYPIYRPGYTYVRPYVADRVYAPSRSVPPPAAPAAAARSPYDTSFCREYTRQIVIDGEEQTAYGTACRQSDGTWRILN